jgi:hypothetical protein
MFVFPSLSFRRRGAIKNTIPHKTERCLSCFVKRLKTDTPCRGSEYLLATTWLLGKNSTPCSFEAITKIGKFDRLLRANSIFLHDFSINLARRYHVSALVQILL